MTALHYAMIKNNAEIGRMLLAAGADWTIKDKVRYHFPFLFYFCNVFFHPSYFLSLSLGWSHSSPLVSWWFCQRRDAGNGGGRASFFFFFCSSFLFLFFSFLADTERVCLLSFCYCSLPPLTAAVQWRCFSDTHNVRTYFSIRFLLFLLISNPNWIRLLCLFFLFAIVGYLWHL